MGELLDAIKFGAANSVGSGAVGLGLGAISGAIQKKQQEESAEKLAKLQNEIARQNALDKWSIEKASMQKAGINMAAINGMQTAAIQQATPTPSVNNQANVPPIMEGAQQSANTELTKTETEKNEEFLKQAGDYWASETKVRLQDASLKSSAEVWNKLQVKTGNYEYDVRRAVIDAYGGETEYGKALFSTWKKQWEDLDSGIKLKMSQVGLNEENCRLAAQKTIESKEFIKLGWYNAATTRMYNEGMLKLGNDRLEFDKNAFKSNLWFEIDKFNRSIGLEYKKFNWQKGVDEVQMQYTKTLIKNLDQERYWKPISVLSTAFRDVTIGLSSMKGAQRNENGFKDKLGNIFSAAMIARLVTKIPL